MLASAAIGLHAPWRGGERVNRVVAVEQTGRMIDEVVESTAHAWDVVRECLRAWPDAQVYVDGQRLHPMVKARILEELAELADPPASPEMVMAPERIPEFAESVCRFFDDAFQSQIKGLDGFVTLSQRYGELLLERERRMVERERELADEAVRQRKLLHQSLADIDLLDRSVTVARFRHAAARADRPRESSGYSFMDFVSGLSGLAGLGEGAR